MLFDTAGVLGVLTILTILAMLGSLLLRPRGLTRPRLAIGVLCLALLGLHLLLEGLRWQMTPAYVLAIGVGFSAVGRWVFAARPSVQSSQAGQPRGRVALRAAAILGLLAVGIEVFALTSFPVVRLPAPSGPYAVGTTYLEFSDSSRAETLTDDPIDQRQFKGRVWYPAELPADGKPLDYQHYVSPIKPLVAGVPTFIFSHYHLSRSNSYLDIPVSSREDSYPVLFFSVGFQNRLDDYQIFAEELASRGYVVLVLDTPYESEAVRQPDGAVVTYTDAHADAFHQHEDEVYPLWERFWKKSTTVEERESLARQILTVDTFMGPVLRIRVADTQFAVDELQRINAGTPDGLLAGKLDLSRLAVLGHSLGGAVAGQTCLVDARFRACVNLDGFQWGDVANGAITQPYMLIYSDQFEGANDFMLGALKNRAYILMVKGSTHGNFQDTPVVMPGAKFVGIGGSIDAKRMNRLVADYVDYFLQEALTNDSTPLRDGPLPQYPEVQFEVREHADGPSSLAPR